MYAAKVKNIGRTDIEIFFIKLFVMYPIELSDNIIIPNPIKKAMYLFFVYLMFSFEVKINNKEIKVKTGR